jgi:hypothetical protein
MSEANMLRVKVGAIRELRSAPILTNLACRLELFSLPL